MVRLCVGQSPIDANGHARLVALLATGLERWLSKGAVEPGTVDFPADVRITSSHDDKVNEELPWR